MFVLAVDIDQALGEIAHLRECDGGAVDKRLRASARIEHPTEQHHVLVIVSELVIA